MQLKFARKKDGRIVDFDISKIQEQINFSVEDTSISAIEFDCIILPIAIAAITPNIENQHLLI